MDLSGCCKLDRADALDAVGWRTDGVGAEADVVDGGAMDA